MTKKRGDAFEEGDRVFHPVWSYCTLLASDKQIASVRDARGYIKCVRVEDVYHANTEAIAFDTTEPLQLEMDAAVWVRLSEYGDWSPRHFARFDDGKISCWDYGQTSHTAVSSSNWSHYRLTDPNGTAGDRQIQSAMDRGET